MGGRSPTPAPCCPPWSRGGQERSLYCGTLPPVSPSPSFSSIFHSSCFLHKAGVSRDSSQMFSAAHHIAFLMKYSWSLSAFCHESLLQLPAMETLCEAAFLQSHSPGAPDPPPRACHLAPSHGSSFLFLLPQAVPEQGLRPTSPRSWRITKGAARANVPGTPVSPRGRHQPRGRVRPRLGGVGGWMDTLAWGTEASHPTPAKTTPGVAEAEASSAGTAPVLPPAPSQPAALAMLCTIIQLGCLCKQSGFMFR